MSSLVIMKYPLWMKWGIRVGVVVFFAMAVLSFYSVTKIHGEGALLLQLFLVVIGSSLSRITARGFILFPYLDSTIAFGR